MSEFSAAQYSLHFLARCHCEETAEAPPVADEAKWFRGSVPVFTPQRGWKPADTTVFRIAEAPPVAYFSQQFFLFVSDGILFVNSDKKYAKSAV